MPPHYGKFIAYFRVSTDRQGKSGLGLAAQREAVMSYLDGGRWALVDEFTEVESGKRNDRPELEKAPRLARGKKPSCGRVYEYFLGGFAGSEGKRGGEFYTPRSVRVLVEMLEPYKGARLRPLLLLRWYVCAVREARQGIGIARHCR
jgi:hypothetical protein